MSDMQQRLAAKEGTHDAWQMRNYMRDFVTVNRGDVQWQNRAIDAPQFLTVVALADCSHKIDVIGILPKRHGL